MGKNDIREEIATFISFARNDEHSGRDCHAFTSFSLAMTDTRDEIAT